MRRFITACGTLPLCLAVFATFADTPPATAAAAPSGATSVASAPPAPASPPPTDTATSSDRPPETGGLTEAEVTRAFAKYRKTHRQGTIKFCRVEKPLGTRIGTSVCLTEDQVLARARAERDAPQLLSQRGVCTSANAACVSP